jgi:hypothetical protein
MYTVHNLLIATSFGFLLAAAGLELIQPVLLPLGLFQFSPVLRGAPILLLREIGESLLLK